MTEAVSAEAVAGLVAGATHVVRQLSQHPGYEGSFIKAKEWIEASSKALTTLAAEVEALRRERDNLQARLTARANSMLKLRDSLSHVHDNIEDEGDRSYFGSTNDADTFKDAWQDLDGWAWDDIMADGKLPDVYETSRKAHTRAATLAAELAQCREALEWYGEKATAIHRYMVVTPPRTEAALSVVTELDLDAGNRARTALKGASHEPDA